MKLVPSSIMNWLSSNWKGLSTWSSDMAKTINQFWTLLKVAIGKIAVGIVIAVAIFSLVWLLNVLVS